MAHNIKYIISYEIIFNSMKNDNIYTFKKQLIKINKNCVLKLYDIKWLKSTFGIKNLCSCKLGKLPLEWQFWGWKFVTLRRVFAWYYWKCRYKMIFYINFNKFSHGNKHKPTTYYFNYFHLKRVISFTITAFPIKYFPIQPRLVKTQFRLKSNFWIILKYLWFIHFSSIHTLEA